MPVRDLDVVSPLLPGGTLVRAIFDRFLMQRSDRGGASGAIGTRWADVCDEWLRGQSGQAGSLDLDVERVVRLDDSPAIARAASRRNLQNPDFLLVGRRQGQPAIQAADAKFSVETARSKQVSREVVSALAQLGPMLSGPLGFDPDGAVLVPGIFLCPDFSLTHLMLAHRAGIMRTTVRRDEVILIPVEPAGFGSGLESAALMAPLHGCDGLPVSPADSLLALVYYFRIARACVGCWLDETGPLLTFNDPRDVDETAVSAAAAGIAPVARSAYDLVVRWHERARAVQEQRRAVDQAVALPISGRELRAMVAAEPRDGRPPPSVNHVRRRLAAWHRATLREAFGPLLPPMSDFNGTLRALATASRALAPEARREAGRIIAEGAAEVDAVQPVPN